MCDLSAEGKDGAVRCRTVDGMNVNGAREAAVAVMQLVVAALRKPAVRHRAAIYARSL